MDLAEGTEATMAKTAALVGEKLGMTQVWDEANVVVPVTVLRVPREALAQWLQPQAGGALERHFYIVDPLGNWMMRAPAEADAPKLRRDLEKLMRGSAGWDNAGRP